MRWIFFAIFAYLALALDFGLRPLLALGPERNGVVPEFTLILAIYVGLWAPSTMVGWCCLILGAATDLLNVRGVVPGAEASYDTVGAILGPYALAFLVGGYAIVQTRALVYRESPLALAVIAFAVGAIIHLVAMLLLTFRGVPLLLGEPLAGWSVTDELVHQFLRLVYTAFVAVPTAMLLFRIYPAVLIDPLKGAHTFRR